MVGERVMVPFAGVDTSRVLLEGMKLAERSSECIANNIANVDTPHYNPVHLDFQKSLRAAIEGRGGIALRTNRPRHLDSRQDRQHFEGLAFLSKNDYNKVDLDSEMARLGANTGRYVMYASLLSKRFDVVKNMLSSVMR